MRVFINPGMSAVAAALFASAFASPAAADFVSISRCNAPGGSSAPVLHVVNGGTRFTIAIGQNGLTRDTIFNEYAALAWAAASGLFPGGTVFGNYAGHVCGLPNEDTADVPEEPEEPEVEQPEEPETPEVTDQYDPPTEA